MALRGIRVVEFAGLAPGPFAGLILADWGADVIRVDRPGSVTGDTLCRNKRSIAVDSKDADGLALLKRLISRADVVIDPFRPGVMERMGLGPDVFLGKDGLNPRVVYARLAGFSPTGPHKDIAGHDLNYLALSGVLSMFPGDDSKPSFPLNLLADFGGGGMTCALGILLAIIERQSSEAGQVVSTNMVSGTRYLSTYPLMQAMMSSIRPSNSGSIPAPLFPPSPSPSSKSPNVRMTHALDGGAPFYNIYACADQRWVSVACLEPRFFNVFLEKLLPALPSAALQGESYQPTLERQYNTADWPRMKSFLERAFKLFERDRWAEIFQDSDACVVPVLSPAEAATLAAKSDNGSIPGVGAVPEPHPHLSRTPARPLKVDQSYLVPGMHTAEVLAELGLEEDAVARLRRKGVVSFAERSKL